MTSYVALLRGINVGGHNKVPMARLREVLTEAGIPQPRTYIQSGNIVFESDKDHQGLVELIGRVIKAEFGLDVPVVVRDRDELDAVLAARPFGGRDLDPAKLMVTFLSGPLSNDQAASLVVPEGLAEEIVVGNREVYVYYPDGAGRSKLKDSLFNRAYKGVIATTRNERTVARLRELMDDDLA